MNRPRALAATAPAGVVSAYEPVRLSRVKRLADIALAAAGILLLAPLMLVIALAVALTSPGPVIHRQQRLGLAGVPFTMPKFRTMRCTDDGSSDAHLETGSLLELRRSPSLLRNDARITAVGRILRRWSLDELPQLWSVIRGDMSIVGPRPMLVDELPLLAPRFGRRHVVRPGLTGLWQVSGRKEVPWDDRMTLDVAYVDSMSLAGDWVIIARTIPAVIRGSGAY